MYTIVNALVVNKSDEAMKDVENGNDVEAENVVVNRHHHDRENEILLGGARRDEQTNVSSPCTECLTRTSSVVKSDNASAVCQA